MRRRPLLLGRFDGRWFAVCGGVVFGGPAGQARARAAVRVYEERALEGPWATRV